MHQVIPLLLEALTLGAVRLRYGRIVGRSGYVDVPTRTIVLNPDADLEQLIAELGHDLEVLLEHTAVDDEPEPVARLALAHSVAEPEQPRPALDGPTIPVLRVAGAE